MVYLCQRYQVILLIAIQCRIGIGHVLYDAMGVKGSKDDTKYYVIVHDQKNKIDVLRPDQRYKEEYDGLCRAYIKK